MKSIMARNLKPGMSILVADQQGIINVVGIKGPERAVPSGNGVLLGLECTDGIYRLVGPDAWVMVAN